MAADRSDELVEKILAMRDRLATHLPDVDPGDLLLIAKAIVRGPGSRKRMFLHKLRSGGYVV